jgi:hypothetical protein
MSQCHFKHDRWHDDYVNRCVCLLYDEAMLPWIEYSLVDECESGFGVECLVRASPLSTFYDRIYLVYHRGQYASIYLKCVDQTTIHWQNKCQHSMFAHDREWKSIHESSFSMATLHELSVLPTSFLIRTCMYSHETEQLNREKMNDIWNEVKDICLFDRMVFETDEYTFLVERDTLCIDNGKDCMTLSLTGGMCKSQMEAMFPRLAVFVERERSMDTLVRRMRLGHVGRRLYLLACLEQE